MARSISALRQFGFVLCWLLTTLLPADAVHAGTSPPAFSKAFLPSTIGPGSVSTLTFTIANTDLANPVTDLAFIDVLPAGVTIADPASATTTCTDATLAATGGGGTITFSGGLIGAGASCTVAVNVTSLAAGTHTNVSGPLGSSAGSGGTASADLTVALDRPGFSKSFVPASVGLGGRSTLTFTIDNTANPSLVFALSFTDTLPAGIVIASPANPATTCPGGTVSAPQGGSLISYTATSLAAGSSCTVTVDVIGMGGGVQVNTSGELSSAVAGPTRSSGKATAALEIVVGTVAIAKTFTNDPVPPSGTVELEITLRNLDRNFDATAIAFTDDLDATLTGLVAVGLPATNVCGPGSSLTGTDLLIFTGGNLAADGGSCTFSVTLQVPAGAAAGAHPNTTSPVSASLGGSPFVGPPASETLFVSAAPSLSKSFLSDPVGAGDFVMVEFTLTNNSTTSPATAISFRDNLDAFLNGVIVSSLPATGFCGAGSSLANVVISSDRYLVMSGGSLSPGGSCTFSVELQIPVGTVGTTYLNNTEAASATVDGVTQLGRPASDTLTVVSAPRLRKQFTDDPALPGDTVTLEFILSYPESAGTAATAITFTDDLGATLAGLTAVGLPASDVCGTGSVLSGTTQLLLTGATLDPGATCTFDVVLQVPAGALPGSYPNVTSDVMATVGGVTTTGPGGGDTLQVAGLSIRKTFTDDPVLPGGTVTLEFTIESSSPTDDATGITFTDNLNSTLSGLVAVGLPVSDVCGAGSQISGTSNLSLTGGNLLAGASCTFSVTLQVPTGAADGVYLNTTSPLGATVGGSPVSLPRASDALTVSSQLLLLTKTFTDDPVAPGGMVTLEFTLDNLDPAQPASAITFTDDLDTALAGLAAVGLPVNDVCGAGSQLAGTGLLTLAGGSLAAGGSCTFSVTLQVPAAVPFGTPIVNTTSQVTGTIGGLGVSGAPASDQLVVELLSFSKSFDGPTTAGGMPVLTFFIASSSISAVIGDLRFLDDLAAVLPGLVAVGLPMTDVCGAGSVLSGSSMLTLQGGSLLPGGSCSIPVTLQVPAAAAPGTYTNTTSELFQAGTGAAAPATAELRIEPAPGFAKAFAPASVIVGSLSTLTFTIDNTASAVAASALSFSDNLPAGLAVASPAAASTTCTGGTLTAVPGSGVVSYAGGTVAAGASCTVQADVVATTGGELLNTSGDLTSSAGNSGPASATLTVVEALLFQKAFLGAPILPGGLVELEYTITNPSASAGVVSVSFDDDLGAVIAGLAAVGLPASDVCGAGSQLAGTTVVSLSGGNLPPGGSCTFSALAQVPAGAPLGIFTSTTGPLGYSPAPPLPAASLQTAPAAADLEVDFLGSSKAFAVGSWLPGAVVELTFTIVNPDPVNPAAGIGFEDDLDAVLPGLAAIGLPQADVCGTGSQISGTSLLALTDGTLGPGESCVFTVMAQIPGDALAGTYTNLTSALQAVVGGSVVVGGPASVASADLLIGFSPIVIPTLGTAGLLALIGLLLVAGWLRLRAG